VVVDVLEGSEGSEKGVQEGDAIVSINDTCVVGMSLDEVRRQLATAVRSRRSSSSVAFLRKEQIVQRRQAWTILCLQSRLTMFNDCGGNP
jgi:hypothetical protein